MIVRRIQTDCASANLFIAEQIQGDPNVLYRDFPSASRARHQVFRWQEDPITHWTCCHASCTTCEHKHLSSRRVCRARDQETDTAIYPFNTTHHNTWGIGKDHADFLEHSDPSRLYYDSRHNAAISSTSKRTQTCTSTQPAHDLTVSSPTTLWAQRQTAEKRCVNKPRLFLGAKKLQHSPQQRQTHCDGIHADSPADCTSQDDRGRDDY